MQNGQITLDQYLYAVQQAKHEVFVAFLLTFSMLSILCMMICLAFGWRRVAPFFGVMYGAFITLTENGHALVIGPVCAILSLVWLVREIMAKKKEKFLRAAKSKASGAG